MTDGVIYVTERRERDSCDEWLVFTSETWWTMADAQEDAANRNRAFRELGLEYRAAEYVRREPPAAGEIA